jgi:signal recognition particle subunit SRP68
MWSYSLHLFSLQLLLFEAERAWAYSHELTAQSLDPAKAEKRSALRHSATSRFRRAINWSTQLLSLAQSLYASKRLPAENILELTIYTLILNGRFLRLREERLQDALSQLSVAKYLLDNLCTQATSSRDQALATLLIDEIGPEIRYCAHQLGNKKAYDVDGIVQELAAVDKVKLVKDCDSILAALREETVKGAQGSLKQKLNTLVWEGKPVPVRNPELVDTLLKVQEAEARLAAAKKSSGGDKVPSGTNITKRSVGAYDTVLSALSDSEPVARKQVETQQVGVGIPSPLARNSYILDHTAKRINCSGQRRWPRCRIRTRLYRLSAAC